MSSAQTANEGQCLLEEQRRPQYDESIFQEVPVYTNCPFCDEKIVSRTRLKHGKWTYWATALLCIFQCYCCLCVPFCVDDLKNIVHECPKCEKQLGEYKQFRLFQRRRPRRQRRQSLLF